MDEVRAVLDEFRDTGVERHRSVIERRNAVQYCTYPLAGAGDVLAVEVALESVRRGRGPFPVGSSSRGRDGPAEELYRSAFTLVETFIFVRD